MPTIVRQNLGIALFGYNRPILVKNSLESLKRQSALSNVHVWIDGDQGSVARREQCETVRKVASAYPVARLHTHRGNLGFRKMILQALNYMMEHYEYLLILEDDCFPTSRAVETFCQDLKYIEGRDDIFSVYGHHFELPNETREFTRFQGWGWATTTKKLRNVFDDLLQCYLMTEEEFLRFTQRALTDEVLNVIDVTPGRQPSLTLKAFYAWDETMTLLTALHGMRHLRSSKRVIYNCGAGADSTHFSDVDWYRKPPFNMISPDQVWDVF